MAELIILPSGKKVGHDWTIDHKLGAGSFGAVYRCSNSKGEIFALKVSIVLKNMEEIGRFKRSCRSDIPMKQLFGGCPREYIDLMRLIDGGKFFDEPKYGMMYSILRKALNNLGVQVRPTST
uniref:Protein kinase domain-containing protein n=1 Tax=Parascaris equorum TaxID=6256 RepID=A0A914S4L6_PAREQ